MNPVDMAGVDIAAASVVMKAQQVQTQVDVAVLKNSMDAQSEIAELMISELMDVSMVDISL